jgi:hypothetical protein
MSTGWHAEPARLDESWRAVARLDRTNPFLTRAYVDATRHFGEPWKLSLNDEHGNLSTASVGYLRRGRLECALEILSLPRSGDWESLWPGLHRFCRDKGVTRLLINTFHAPPAPIPTMGIEVVRRRRREFLLNLEVSNWPPRWSSNHRRNVNKARRLGLVVERQTSPAACEAHARLIDASMERRQHRGEDVSVGSDASGHRRFLETGSGVLYQVRDADQVLSSMLVLLAERGAYYHSAGTSEIGMSKGASMFLIQELAGGLRDEGFELFNLGGADVDQEGLARFKQGFHPTAVELEAAEFFLGNALKKNLLEAVRKLRHYPGKLLGGWFGPAERATSARLAPSCAIQTGRCGSTSRISATPSHAAPGRSDSTATGESNR